MKMLKILGAFLFLFGVFAVVGSVSAADADLVQPAEVAVFNEEVQVNGTLQVAEPGYFPSVHIGSTEAGVGGVTYFNGTIINASVDDEGEDNIPVTFGDDVRIDGTIWRGPESGTDDDMPVRIMDNVYVEGDLEVNQALSADTVMATSMFQLPIYSGTDINTDLAEECTEDTDKGKMVLFKDTDGDATWGITADEEFVFVCSDRDVPPPVHLGWFPLFP